MYRSFAQLQFPLSFLLSSYWQNLPTCTTCFKEIGQTVDQILENRYVSDHFAASAMEEHTVLGICNFGSVVGTGRQSV